jgi:hypothetical protein
MPKRPGDQNRLRRVLPDCRELYRRCHAQQQEVDRQETRLNKETGIAALAFGPLLPCNPELESLPLATDPLKLRVRKNQWLAEKYRKLLGHTKTASQGSLEQLYQILAMWLKDEGIISPKDFLSRELYSRLTKTTRKLFGSYRPAEKYYADSVEVWIPYLEHLVTVYRLLHQKKEKHIGDKLKEKGFDVDAVRIVVHQQVRTRSALSAAIQFVAFRKELDENTIRTAHSRIYGRIRKNLPKMTFPE